jgi:hypothetical protein
MAAFSAGFRPSAVSSVTCAVEIANSRSSVGFSSFVRPSSESNNPIGRSRA